MFQKVCKELMFMPYSFVQIFGDPWFFRLFVSGLRDKRKGDLISISKFLFKNIVRVTGLLLFRTSDQSSSEIMHWKRFTVSSLIFLYKERRLLLEDIYFLFSVFLQSDLSRKKNGQIIFWGHQVTKVS